MTTSHPFYCEEQNEYFETSEFSERSPDGVEIIREVECPLCGNVHSNTYTLDNSV